MLSKCLWKRHRVEISIRTYYRTKISIALAIRLLDLAARLISFYSDLLPVQACK